MWGGAGLAGLTFRKLVLLSLTPAGMWRGGGLVAGQDLCKQQGRIIFCILVWRFFLCHFLLMVFSIRKIALDKDIRFYYFIHEI